MFYNDILSPLMAIRFLLSLYSAVGSTFLPPATSETQPESLDLVSDAKFLTSQMRKESRNICPEI